MSATDDLAQLSKSINEIDSILNSDFKFMQRKQATLPADVYGVLPSIKPVRSSRFHAKFENSDKIDDLLASVQETLNKSNFKKRAFMLNKTRNITQESRESNSKFQGFIEK